MTIRPAREADTAAIAAIYRPHVLTGAASFEAEAPDPAEIARRMTAGSDRYPWLVAEEPSSCESRSPGFPTVQAYAYAAPFAPRAAYRWTVETTIYVADAAQRRGVARRLYAALLAALEQQGYAQAIARIALPNEPSVALHEVLGFRHAGTLAAVGHKHGRWIDVGLWQRALAAVPAP